MAWTTPITLTEDSIWTSAQWNSGVRDNLLETMAGKATSAGGWFVATGANAIAQRSITSASVNTSETTTSTSYANLATNGPAVTVTTGTQAIVMWNCLHQNSSANASCSVSVDVAGATTRAASDSWRSLTDGLAAANGWQGGSFVKLSGLTAGSNTFRMQYKVSSGTGTFANRELLVFAM